MMRKIKRNQERGPRHPRPCAAQNRCQSDGAVPSLFLLQAVSSDVLEFLIYESTEPNALLKQVEYFVAKTTSRSNISLENWNRYYHDHAAEIATGASRYGIAHRSRPRASRRPPLTRMESFFICGGRTTRRLPKARSRPAVRGS
ncbi:MAG: hypothetical protein DMG38_02855 [Acidobacteria bacterium]|nr:MAG: hypothetical protein DMG38_02855 [Acidobacteriota bacterium]